VTCALAQRETAELMNVQPPDSHQLFVSPVLDVRLTQIFRSKAVEMKLMIDGIWRGDVALTASEKSHPIETGSFRGRVTVDGSSGFVAEAGRYHLYASYACPFAHRVILGRVLKRLQNVVGLSVLHPTWNTLDGWVFGETPLSTNDGGGGSFTHLHQAYTASRPSYTGKITVPVLWDSRTRQIVSNESLDILMMFNDAFNGIGADPSVDLYPRFLRCAIDELNGRIARDLARRVYAIGAAMTQQQYDQENAALFAFLDDLELRLSDKRPFLHGEADRQRHSRLHAARPVRRRLQSAVSGEPQEACRLSAARGLSRSRPPTAGRGRKRALRPYPHALPRRRLGRGEPARHYSRCPAGRLQVDDDGAFLHGIADRREQLDHRTGCDFRRRKRRLRHVRISESMPQRALQGSVHSRSQSRQTHRS